MSEPNHVPAFLSALGGLLTGLAGGYFGLRSKQVDTLQAWQQQMLAETHALREECARLRATLHDRDHLVLTLQGQLRQLQSELQRLRAELHRVRQRLDRDQGPPTGEEP